MHSEGLLGGVVQGVVRGAAQGRLCLCTHLKDALREAERHVFYLRGRRLARRIGFPTR